MSDLEIAFGAWKLGARYGNHSTEVVTEDGSKMLAAVRTHIKSDKDWTPDATGEHVAAIVASAPRLMWNIVRLLNVLNGFTRDHPDEVDVDAFEAVRCAHEALTAIDFPEQLLPPIPPSPYL